MDILQEKRSTVGGQSDQHRSLMTASQVLCVVESNAAVDELLRGDMVSRTWLTTSPAVYERLLRDRHNVCFLDADAKQSEADAIGYLASDLARWLSDRIDAQMEPTALKIGRALRATLQRCLVRFLYKGFLLDRILSSSVDHRRLLVVGDPRLEPVSSFTLLPHRFETLFAPIAHAIGVPVHSFKTQRPRVIVEKGDIYLPTAADRLLTVINAELSAIVFKAWSLLLRGPKLGLRPGQRRPLILIDGSNELIEEIFAKLLLRGYSVAKLPIAESSLGPVTWDDAISSKELDLALSAAAGEHGVVVGEAMRAACRLALRRLYDCLRFAPAMIDKANIVARRVSDIAADRSVAVLAANMHAGYPLLLMQALNAAGIHTFKPEHGCAPGQSPLHISLSRLAHPDTFTDSLYYTRAQLEEAKAASDGAVTCTVIGAPQCTKRPKWLSLQRALMRRRLGLNGRHIVWCSGIYPNNLQMFPHYWRDGPYHLGRKALIESSLAGLNDRVTIKLHPAARYVDGDPIAGGMQLPKNCVAIPDQDFRYLRTAADVVIVDGPGSVLGWAVGLGVPVIFVEFGMYCLTAEAETAFRKGLLFIDAREVGWEDRLRALLQMPHHDLIKQYEALAQDREALLEGYIFGPSGSSAERAVDYITQRLKSKRTA